tara:strand:- start:115 stop:861 length:747 start_codon:yes stop_codon:yes gene_type:complete
MKNILITGASSGLGLFLTKYFNNADYEITAIGKNKSKIKKLKSYLQNKNKKNCLSMDLNNQKNLYKLFKYLKGKKYNAVIHCLGGGFGKHDPLINKKDLDYLFNLNVGIAVAINKEIIEKKLYKSNLKLVHIGSVAGLESTGSVGYSMVKASLISYTKTLSKHLINKNIFVHCVLPGAFVYENNSFERLKIKNRKVYNNFIIKKLPRKKIAQAENMIGLFKLLISEEGNMLTGSAITIDFTESNSFRL